jgi:hypothetical protein
MTRIASAALAALLVLSLVAGVPLAAADEVVAVDADHALAEESTIEAYADSGVATADIEGMDMSVTVAQDSKQAGLDGFHVDSTKTYLQVQYREERSRTVRIYVPDDYITPRPKRGLQAETSRQTATLSPVEGGNYTAVELTLDEPTNATFAISKTSGAVFSVRSRTRGFLGRTFGVSLPSFGGDNWQHVDTAALAGENTTAAINHDNQNMTLQYDADPAAGSESWLAVPECDDGTSASVCQFEKEGIDNRTYLLSTAEDPPAVRYQEGEDPMANSRSAVEDIKRVPSRIMDDISKLWGGS